MDIREVRRRNLKLLMDREFGAGTRGAQSRLAEKLGKPQNFVSRCLADPSRPGSKTIGEDFAREIEQAFKLSRYAMDSPDGLGTREEPDAEPANTAAVIRQKDEHVGSPAAAPIAAQLISVAFAQGKLNDEDIAELTRIARHLIRKNAEAKHTAVPQSLESLAEAAFKTAESGGNPDDLLKMLEHGLNKSRPKDSSKPNESEKKFSQ